MGSVRILRLFDEQLLTSRIHSIIQTDERSISSFLKREMLLFRRGREAYACSSVFVLTGPSCK